MSDSNSSSGGSGWIVGVMVFIAALMLLLLAFVAFGNTRGRSTSTDIAPIAGAVAMPTPTKVVASPAVPTAVDVQEFLLQPGRRVAAISPDGSGTRIYGDSRLNALVLDVYQDGAAFEIMEPGTDVTAYPVENDGRTWYRVRASDGLVGWVIVDRLVPLEE